MSDKLRVTVWNEYKHEVDTNHPASTIYPEGMHKVIADYLNNAGFAAGTATLAEPEHGLTEEVLANTDVLIWWGHMAHHEVSDEIVARVHARVLAGMGLVVLHSGHFSKIFQRLMGTTCNLKWREAGENERLWVIDRTHPIAAGLPEWIDLPEEEMYGEPFDIPAPDQLVLISWFAGGEVFRSGACWSRGHGKVFYFRPGHESHPTYYNEQVLQVIANGVRWAAPLVGQPKMEFGNVQPLESLD